MEGALSFPQLYLCLQPPLQSSPRICSYISVNFHLPVQPLLVPKIILTISSNTPFLYTSVILHVLIHCEQPARQSTSKIFSLPQPFSIFRQLQGTRKQGSLVRTENSLISLFLLKVWTVITGLTTTDFLSLRLRKLVSCRW